MEFATYKTADFIIRKGNCIIYAITIYLLKRI